MQFPALKKAEREGSISLPKRIADPAQLEMIYRNPEEISSLNAKIEELGSIIDGSTKEIDPVELRQKANSKEADVNHMPGVTKSVMEFQAPPAEVYKPSKIFQTMKTDMDARLQDMRNQDLIDDVEFQTLSAEIKKPELLDEVHRMLTNCVIKA